MSNFNPSDSGTYRNLKEIKSVLTQIEEKAEDLLKDFKSRKDKRPFEPGNVQEAFKDFRGDPRRPNLTSIIANIVLDSVTPTTTAADIQATVEELTGDDVTDSDITEIVYKVLDASNTEIASSSFEFQQSDDPVTNTASLSGLTSATNYSAQVDLDVNGSTKDSEQADFYTESNTLYNPAAWDSLVHYWSLDNSGDDDVGSINYTVEGTPNTPTGVANGAYAFDGTDDRLINTSVSGLPTDEVSFSIWFNVPDVSADKVALANGADDATEPNSLIGYNNTADSIRATLTTADDGTVTVDDTDTPASGTEYHVVVTYDGSNIDLWVNNTNNTTVNATGNIQYDTTLVAGYDPNSQTYNSFNYIDEIMVFNKSLSASEVDELYQAGA